MTSLIAAGSGLVGLVIGSFLNVVAHRVPRKESVVAPRSACPHCGADIRARDNIPVLSWFLLRGRCRDCGEPISPRYPVVEATTAVLFVATALLIGANWVLPGYLWFVGLTVALTLTDLDHKLIPNRILYPGTAVGTGLLFVGALLDGNVGGFLRGLLAGAAYFVALLVLALIAGGGFGFGDVKLAFLLGLFTGYLSWGAVGVAAFLAFLTGGIVSVLLLVTRRKGRKDAIPFGPYLVLGAYLAIAFGDVIVDWYLG